MIFGVPASELLLLATLIVLGGLVTGVLAGLFGIGGGTLIVPVLYEVFGAMGVAEEVRFQLCIGTSLAIIVPTSIFSFLTHHRKGAVMMDIVRRWALPAIVGVATGSTIAAFAPAAVLKLAFVVIAGIIAAKLLLGRESWRVSDHLPGRAAMGLYGFTVGLCGSLIGVSGGSISNMFLTLHGISMHRAVATSAGLGVPAGLDAAALHRLRIAHRVCLDGAGFERHCLIRCASCACAVQAAARSCLWLLSLVGVRAVSREYFLVGRVSLAAGVTRRLPSFQRRITLR
jgi:uncharacterized protein